MRTAEVIKAAGVWEPWLCEQSNAGSKCCDAGGRDASIANRVIGGPTEPYMCNNGRSGRGRVWGDDGDGDGGEQALSGEVIGAEEACHSEVTRCHARSRSRVSWVLAARRVVRVAIGARRRIK